jgi:hypothetical protein
VTQRITNFLETLKEEEVLVFERIKKFLVDIEDFVPFVSQKPLNSCLLSKHDLARARNSSTQKAPSVEKTVPKSKPEELTVS